MRGAQREIDSRGDAVRIIPADAGSTASGEAKTSMQEDHPRGCGEHL